MKKAVFLFLGNIATDRRVKNFLSVFAADGWHCELIYATPGKADSKDHPLESGIQARQIGLKPTSGPMMFINYYRSLKKELARHGNYDVIFSCDLYSLRAAVKHKKNTRGELVYDAREIYTGLPSLMKSLVKRWIWKRVEFSGLAKTGIILVTAKRDANAILGAHSFLPRSLLVRNLPLRTSPPKRNDYLREYFPLIGARKILVYVGGLQSDRGLEEMINAMTKLRGEAVFVMIGDGAIRETLQKQTQTLHLEESVFFHPSLDSDSVISVLASANIGISLINTRSQSYTFALPSKIFEYVHAGLPVLTTDLIEVKDLFRNAEWIQYSQLTTESIVRAIHTLSALPDMRTALQKLAEQFTFEKDAKSLLTLLDA